MSIEVVGLEEVLARLDRIVRNVSSGRVGESSLAPGMERLRVFAVSISPEITGRYKAAFAVEIDEMKGTLFNDVPYVADVEERHHVFARTVEASGEAFTEVVRDLLREIVR